MATKCVGPTAFGNVIGEDIGAELLAVARPYIGEWRGKARPLGSSLVDQVQPTQGEGPWSSANYRNGSDIESDNAYYDRMTQRALQSAGPGLSDSTTDAEVMAYRMREAGFDGDMVPTGGAMPVGPGLKVMPRPLAFKPLLQLNEGTGLMGFDQGNGVWSYPVPDRPAIETRPLGAAANVMTVTR